MSILILYFVCIVFMSVFGVLFYYQDKREQKLIIEISKLSKIQADIQLLQENCVTLRDNQNVLSKDIESLLHEFKDIEKKVKLTRGT